MKSNVKSEEYNDFLNELSGYYPDPSKQEEKVPVGERLRKIREMEGLSIEQLAKNSGFDELKLRNIEEQKIYPDLGTIIQLSKALRIASGLLLGEESGYGYSVVRKQERKNIQRHASGSRDNPNYIYQSLASGVKDRHMNAFVVTLKEDVSSEELSSHDGEEFILVIEGTVKIILGKKTEMLGEGDSIYYLSRIPHLVKNASDRGDAVIIAVVYGG